MFVNAILRIQDVQLVCFAAIFGFLVLQHWADKPRRWLWYSFLANLVGALLDFTSGRLPLWARHGLYLETVPLSDAIVNTAIVYFLGTFRRSQWLAWGIAAAVFPVFLLWSSQRSQVRNGALQDFAIAAESLITAVILVRSRERSTAIPCRVLSGFLLGYCAVGAARAFVAFILGGDPDALHWLGSTSIVAWTLDTSVLPLVFIWMMNSRLEVDLRRQATVDPLTQVLNRRGLGVELERELARSSRSGAPLTVVIADLDHFKQWNDTFGHASGDAVLTGVAALLRRTLRRTDVLARVGGEEFVMVLPHTSATGAVPILQRLCAAVSDLEIVDDLAAPIAWPDSGPTRNRRVTASFGATVGHGDNTPVVLLQEADQALYQAKHDGRNCVRLYDPAQEGVPASSHSERWHGLLEQASGAHLEQHLPHWSE